MISCCIIARNEEQRISACLNSVRTAVSEIIVLDTGSTDRTAALAREGGATVISWASDGPFDFGAARNACQEYATQPWVLALDCDEHLSTPVVLKDTVAQALDAVDAFLIYRRNHFYDASGRYDTDVRTNVRLYRNQPELKWKHSIHEEIWSSVKEGGGSIAHSAVLIDHEMRDHGYQGILGKQEAYLSKIEVALAANPSPYLEMHRGKTLQLLGRAAEAEQAYRAVLSKGATSEVDLLALAYLGLLIGAQGHMAQGETTLAAADQILPQSSLTAFVRGELYFQAGRFEDAAAAYSKARLVGDHHGAPVAVADKYMESGSRAEKLGFCALRVGDQKWAEELLNQAILYPGSASGAHLGLAQLALLRQQPELALQQLDKALGYSPQWEKALNLQSALRS